MVLPFCILLLVPLKIQAAGFNHSGWGDLLEIKGLKFKCKKIGAFGSYGWSGEAVKFS
jgi:flavorubredoxin